MTDHLVTEAYSKRSQQAFVEITSLVRVYVEDGEIAVVSQGIKVGEREQETNWFYPLDLSADFGIRDIEQLRLSLRLQGYSSE